jgi:hypothetical protein
VNTRFDASSSAGSSLVRTRRYGAVMRNVRNERRDVDPALLYGIDVPVMVRGASLGFTALVLGGLPAPLAERIPVLGPAWLPVVALLGSVLAGSRVGAASSPVRHGAAAACSAYLLVVPLLMMSPQRPDTAAIGLAAVAAVLVGGLAGTVAGRLGGD